MFPPHIGMTTFLPFNSGTRPSSTAAKPVAPAPSTTAFSNSNNLKIAIAINSSDTHTDLSVYGAAVAKANFLI